uniref:DNA damage-binding protein 1 n=1 Tax=Blastobotrys adeninivorans TaxID=409370 RepID=A0A060T8Q8_BLAAD
MVEYLLTTVQEPSSVLAAVYASVLSFKERNLVLAKDSSLEIYNVSSEGLELVHSIPALGKITALASFRPTHKSSGSKKDPPLTDWLFVALDNGLCCTIAYDDGEFVILDHLLESFGRVSPSSGHFVAVDQSREFIALHSWQGYVSLFKLRPKPTDLIKAPSSARSKEDGMNMIFQSISDVNLELVTVIALKFVTGFSSSSCLAVLSLEAQQSKVLTLYSIGNNGTKISPIHDTNVPDDTQLLIPLPSGGFLICSPFSVMYYYRSSEDDSVESKMFPIDVDEQELTAFVVIDSTRVIIGTNGGQYLLLVLEYDGEIVKDIGYVPVGQSCPATSIVHLSGNYLFASSHFSHSVLFELDLKKQTIHQLVTIKNLAPISDVLPISEGATDKGISFILGSGGFHMGGLKRITRGRDVNEFVHIDIGSPIQNVWSPFEDTIVVSFLNQTTRAFRLNDGEAEDVTEDLGIEKNSHTIEVGVFTDTHNLAVVSSRRIYTSNRSYCPEMPLSFGSALTNAVVFCSGKQMGVVDANLELLTRHEFDREISAFDAIDGYAVVGFWNSKNIELRDTDNLSLLTSIEVSLDNDAPIRSLCIKRRQGGSLTITLGTGSGQLLLLDYTATTRKLRHDQTINLEPSPVSIHPVSENVILVDSNHRCSLLDLGGNNIIPVQLTNTELVSACSFRSNSSSTNLVAMASGSSIRVGSVSNWTSVGIQELQLNQLIHKLCHAPGGRGLIFILTVGLNPLSGAIKLVNSDTFEILDSYELEKQETGQCIVSILSEQISFRGVMVGTSIEEGTHDLGSEKGRVLLLTITKEQKIELVDSISVASSVYDLLYDEGDFSSPVTRVLASIGPIVQGISITPTGINEGFRISLLPERLFTSPSFTVAMSYDGKSIFFGDLLRGVGVSAIEEGELTSRSLQDRAFSTIDVEGIGENRFIASSMDGEVISGQSSTQGIVLTHKQAFSSPANVIKTVKLGPGMKPTEGVGSAVVLATTAGGVYLLWTISSDLYDRLLPIQTAIKDRIPGINYGNNREFKRYDFLL